MRFKRGDTTPTGYFGTRDASWYARPNVDSTKVFHAACVDGHAACSAWIVIDDSTLVSADELRALGVCARPKCRSTWETLRAKE